MKRLTIIIAIIACAFQNGIAQPKDTVNLKSERANLSRSLTLLRDSISISLKLIEHQNNITDTNRELIESYRKELIEYQKLVNLDLKEISSTAKNSWNYASMERIRNNTAVTRREFKRLRTNLGQIKQTSGE